MLGEFIPLDSSVEGRKSFHKNRVIALIRPHNGTKTDFTLLYKEEKKHKYKSRLEIIKVKDLSKKVHSSQRVCEPTENFDLSNGGPPPCLAIFKKDKTFVRAIDLSYVSHIIFKTL